MKKTITFNKETTPRIDYRDLYLNLENPEWYGWKDAAKIIKSIEAKGSKSRAFPEDSFRHLLNFLNNYFLECEVAFLYDYEFNGDDHDYLYDKAGDMVPDFRYITVTVELKSGWNFDALPILNWYGADVKMFYNKSDNKLYRINDDNTYEAINVFKVKYVCMKNLNIDQRILDYFK